MSDNAQSTNGVELPTEFEPAGGYDNYVALLFGAGSTTHVVRPQTFDNSGVVMGPGGSEYDGYSANIGRADALCGRRLLGRMCPIDTESQVFESQMCSTCLRSLRTETDRGVAYATTVVLVWLAVVLIATIVILGGAWL